MRKTLIIVSILLFLVSVSYAADASKTEEYNRKIEYKGEKQLKVSLDFGMGELKVARAQGDFIAMIHGKYDTDKFKVNVEYIEGKEAELIIKVDHNRKLFDFDGEVDNEWEILLGDMVPLELDLDAGMSEADFDFTGLEITGLNMDVGMAAGSIMFNKPNKGRIDRLMIDCGKSSFECYGLGNANFRQMIIDAGMASVDLDFTGEGNFDGSVELDAGMASASVILNPDMGVRINYDHDWTSSVGIPESKFDEVKKGRYETKNYSTAKGRLDFDIDISMGSLDFQFTESL